MRKERLLNGVARFVLVTVLAFAVGGTSTGCKKAAKLFGKDRKVLLEDGKKVYEDAKIAYDRYKAAHQCVCFGLGSVPCMSCGGGGFKPAMQMTPYGPMSVLEPCGFCVGGRIVCPVCQGAGRR